MELDLIRTSSLRESLIVAKLIGIDQNWRAEHPLGVILIKLKKFRRLAFLPIVLLEELSSGEPHDMGGR